MPLVVPDGVEGVETVSGSDSVTVRVPDKPDSIVVSVAHRAFTMTL